MKFSERWLREWVDPPVSPQDLAEQLTTAGLEVESVESAGGDFSSVVVARVLDVSAHPDADRLRVCQVDFGAAEPATVVCGASNVRSGLVAPYAPVGARITGGKKIRASKIRGVQSCGMLCSPIELGLGEDADGLMELAGDAQPGTDLSTLLDLDDVIIDVDLTPNRGDCLGLIGVAREVAVINRCPLNLSEVPPVRASLADQFPVELLSPEECPKYVGRIIRDINPKASTPAWMVERLRRSGLRSISAVVDITNYVMLEFGQPLHAFDLDTLRGGIRVRKAAQGEELRLLDGQVLSLESDILVIADHQRPVAMAGIMGGDDTGVTDDTRNVFLEAAYFEPRHVSGDARRFGLHTDASHRFERGVDPENQRRAVERASALLIEVVGGSAGEVSEIVEPGCMPERAPVEVRASRIERVLGAAVETAVVTDILERLGLVVTRTSEGWRVTPPGFRFDIAIEADLIEEVARIVGYDALETRRPEAELTINGRPEREVRLNRLKHLLVDRGYREAITYSFVDTEVQALVQPDAARIELVNPISSDMEVMRASLWPGLLQAMVHNINRQQPTVLLFESGLVFDREHGELTQRPVLGGLRTGSASPRQWGKAERPVDFFDLKSDVEALLGHADNTNELLFQAVTHPALHPGQSARVVRGGGLVGWIGKLHPRVAMAMKLAVDVFVFELRLGALQQGILPEFKVLSKFPGVTRDISVVLDDRVSAQSVRNCVGQVSTDVLKNLELIDVYHGEGIDSGKKSVTLTLTYQASSHTLNDEEVETLVTSVVDALDNELGASLRG